DPVLGNTVPMFGPGILTITFVGNKFASGTDGQALFNLEKIETLTLTAGTAATTQTTLNLGPLSLVNPKVSVEDIGFADGKLSVIIGIALDSASLKFGGTGTTPNPSGNQTSSGITAILTGIFATFDLGVGLPGNFSVSATGKFSLNIGRLEIDVPDVVHGQADNILVQYDPKGADDQELVRIDSATLTFPKIHLTGQISPFDTDLGNPNNPLIPGLVIRQNGFTLGQAQLIYAPGAANNTATPTQGNGPQISIGGIVRFNDVRIGVTNFTVNFDADNPIDFDGSIFFATGGAVFFPDSTAFTATISDRNTADDKNPDNTPNTEAMRADLNFENGHFTGLHFNVDTLDVSIANGLLVLHAQNFDLNTEAIGAERVVSFGSIGAKVKIGTLEIGGEARNFGFTADGHFRAGIPVPQGQPARPFAVILNIGGTSGSSLGWPSWLPIQINTLGVEFTDIEQHPEDFTILLSASVTGIKGVSGLQFSGSIEGVRIRPALLL